MQLRTENRLLWNLEDDCFSKNFLSSEASKVFCPDWEEINENYIHVPTPLY